MANARGRFGAPTFVPIANNLILVAILVAFGATVGGSHLSLADLEHHRKWLIFLGLGTTLGVIVQALLLIPSLRRAGLHRRSVRRRIHEGQARMGHGRCRSWIALG